MILYTLLKAAYRVSLHGTGAELEGGVQTPPEPACSAPGSDPARVNNFSLTTYLTPHLKYSIWSSRPSMWSPVTFRIFKNRNICESPIHQEASNKISSKSDEKQRSYSNFSNGVKIAKISECFASRTSNFRFFFRLFFE